MMKLINILTIIGVILSSCNQGAKPKLSDVEIAGINKGLEEQARKDSLFAAYKARKDSIIAVEQDKVIGNIMFGISSDQFYKSYREFERKCEVLIPRYDGKNEVSYQIGDYKWWNIHPEFYNKSLYSVAISGKPIHYEKYDQEMYAQHKAIFEVFNNKFGKPYLINELPKWHTMQKGYTYLVTKWLIGSKTVELSIERWGVTYSLYVFIYQPEIEDKIKKEKIEKEKESAEKALEII